MCNDLVQGNTLYRAIGFRMIKSLSINKFRCFEDAKVGDCRRINVIVGDNSSGKTSLLEAIFLASGPNPEITFRLRTWRGFERATASGNPRDVEDALWGDLFYNFDKTRAVQIAARGDPQHTRRLTITYVPREVFISAVKVPINVPGPAAPVTFRWNISGRHPVEASPRLEDGVIKIPPMPEPPTETFFYAANHTYSTSEAANRLSKLSKESLAAEVVDQFREHYPEVESLDIELFAGTPMIFCKLKSMKNKIPLNMASGGMNKLAAILLAFPTAPKCVVLIDEIENGFYYKRFPEIWRTLLSFCTRYDAQVFATSHSGECLAAAADLAEEYPSEFSVIHVSEGKLNQFTGAKFADAANANIDIR